MKKLLLTLVLVAASAVTASAADLSASYKKASPVESVYSWTGFYGGLNAGAGFTTANIDDKDCYNCDSDHTSGFMALVGGQLGYNWQMRSFVYGFEVDGDWASYNRKYILCGNCNSGLIETTANNATKIDAILSARGRVGLDVENTLIYVTGGVAFADMRNNYQYLNSGGSIRDSWVDNSWHTGIVAGVGVETKWDANWSFRAEWLHYQFQTKLASAADPTTFERFGFGAQTDVIRLGVNYNFMPAIVARY